MNYKLIPIEGNYQLLDGGAMFGNVPKTLWNKWHYADMKNRIKLAGRSLYLEIENKKFLFETGIGAFFEPKLAERYGVQNSDRHMLLSNLKENGIKPEEIDYIVLSHLHFDHIGGLVNGYSEEEMRLLFTNAKYIISRRAWHHACNPHLRDRVSFIKPILDLLLKSDQIIFIDEEDSMKINNFQLQFYFTEGHTPGQMHSLFKIGDEKYFICGDLVPGISWLHIPISLGYDRFSEKSIDEKRNFLNRAINEKWTLFYTHDPEIAFSKCIKDDRQSIIPYNKTFQDDLKTAA